MAKKLVLPIAAALCGTTLLSSNTFAQDIRSIAMGGASVTSGTGVGGFVSNPALLLEAQRQQEPYHFRFGGFFDVRENVDAEQLVEDNKDLLEDINDEIDVLSAQTLTCVPPTNLDDTCLTGTETLGNYAGDAVSVFNQINGEPVDGQGGGDFGFAITRTAIPFSINLSGRLTGAGLANISQADIDYAQDLDNVLSDNVLTVGDIADTAPIEISVSGENITIDVPDDILTSTARTSYLLRTQLAVGLAKSFDLGGRNLDVGITPKFSSLKASSVFTEIRQLDDPGFDLQDELEAAEVTETSVTLDVGATLPLGSDNKLRIGAVVRNLVPESIKTEDGFEFETTPQLVGSAMYNGGRYRVTGDLALNEASQDNFETQRLHLGGELTAGYFDLRGGIQHDLAVDDNPTRFTFGFGVGFLDLAVALDGSKVRGGGLQIAFDL